MEFEQFKGPLGRIWIISGKVRMNAPFVERQDRVLSWISRSAGPRRRENWETRVLRMLTQWGF